MVNIAGPGGINPLQPLGPAATPGAAPGQAGEAGGRSFKEIFQEQLDHVNNLQLEAERAFEQVATKPNPSPEEMDQVMVAARKAQVAFESLMQVRNKLVDAFEELMRMRI